MVSEESVRNLLRESNPATSESHEVLYQSNGNEKQPSLKPTVVDFPRLILTAHDGEKHVVEREHVINENVTHKTEQYIDEITGELRLGTFQYIEKVIEKEIETTTEKVIALELKSQENGHNENGHDENAGISDDEEILNSENNLTSSVHNCPADDLFSEIACTPGRKKKKRRPKKR
ncbi:uncharacterized protein LOC143245793 [Tachypleus tridentatus]|uniref:uncharacterized protein LOC143245793 n=1 Tax=Tachypleus tridentatus TaxID=6853 RepID=UPI003FCFC969